MSDGSTDWEGLSDPWTAEALTRWITVSLVAAAVIVIAGVGAHHQRTFHDEYVWGDLGIAGGVIALYADITWILRGRRTVGERRRLLLDAPHPEPRFDPEWTAVGFEVRELVAPVGASLYHRPDCLLALGRALVVADRSVHERAHRSPCGVCQP